MPTLYEMEQAHLGEVVEAICRYQKKEKRTHANFVWACAHLAENPAGWGFPRSWAVRPNWDRFTIYEFACRDLFGRHQTVHPQAPACRQWPFLPKNFLSRLIWGESPKSLAGDVLTNKEATKWLTDISENRRFRGKHWRLWLQEPLLWLAKGVRSDGHNLIIRGREVALWLKAKASWSCWWTGMPAGYGPDGRMVMAPVHDMIDEVWPADLAAGVKTSPERVFRAVLERKTDEAKELLFKANMPFPKAPWHDTSAVRQIRTTKELVQWSDTLHNCAAGYAERCALGSIYIYIVNRSSMAEVNNTGGIVQHYSARNNQPAERNVKALSAWRKQNGLD